MNNRVIHFEIAGTDPVRLRRFYEKAFGWNTSPAGEGYYMVHPGGDGGIDGGIAGASEGGTGHVTFYVEVANPAATLRAIEKLGGATVVVPTDIPDGPTFALFSDPEGHVVGLLKASAPGA